MLEDAIAIHEYLPIRRSQIENDYIAYLWSSFEQLASSQDSMASSFSATAFHLLFMMAVQYKALRLHREEPEQYGNRFTLYQRWKKDKDREAYMQPTTVFDLSILGESDLFHLFEMVGVDATCIGNCKAIVRRRNNEFMHATGNQPRAVGKHVTHCLNQLSTIQKQFVTYNDAQAKDWVEELTPEDDVSEFLEMRLLDTRLTPADFKEGELWRYFGSVVVYEDAT